MTQCIRDHLKKFHGEMYETAVAVKGLKNSESARNSPSFISNDEPFSMDKFLDLLQRWLVVDDQVCSFLSFKYFISNEKYLICSQYMFWNAQNSVNLCSI